MRSPRRSDVAPCVRSAVTETAVQRPYLRTGELGSLAGCEGGAVAEVNMHREEAMLW